MEGSLRWRSCFADLKVQSQEGKKRNERVLRMHATCKFSLIADQLADRYYSWRCSTVIQVSLQSCGSNGQVSIFYIELSSRCPLLPIICVTARIVTEFSLPQMVMSVLH